jgi:hypothetical protein
MTRIFQFAFAAVVMAVAMQQAAAQPVRGCATGQAMQSSDPSGRAVTCIPVNEADIVGQWAVTGTTSCLQSSNGFNPTTFNPLIPTAGTTSVLSFFATSMGTRTFYADGTGHTTSTNQVIFSPGVNLGLGFSTPGSPGNASTATLDHGFNWTIQSDGTLLINDGNAIVQSIVQPPVIAGNTATIENALPFAGYVSKDKRTIVVTHAGLAIETSVGRDAAGKELNRTPRLCARERVMTRLP